MTYAEQIRRLDEAIAAHERTARQGSETSNHVDALFERIARARRAFPGVDGEPPAEQGSNVGASTVESVGGGIARSVEEMEKAARFLELAAGVLDRRRAAQEAAESPDSESRELVARAEVDILAGSLSSLTSGLRLLDDAIERHDAFKIATADRIIAEVTELAARNYGYRPAAEWAVRTRTTIQSSRAGLKSGDPALAATSAAALRSARSDFERVRSACRADFENAMKAQLEARQAEDKAAGGLAIERKTASKTIVSSLVKSLRQALVVTLLLCFGGCTYGACTVTSTAAGGFKTGGLWGIALSVVTSVFFLALVLIGNRRRASDYEQLGHICKVRAEQAWEASRALRTQGGELGLQLLADVVQPGQYEPLSAEAAARGTLAPRIGATVVGICLVGGIAHIANKAPSASSEAQPPATEAPSIEPSRNVVPTVPPQGPKNPTPPARSNISTPAGGTFIPCTSFPTCNAACEAGTLKSCAAAAEMLLKGSGGATKDEARSYELYVRACNGSEPSGCVGEGWLELNGKGTQKDGPKALASFSTACNDTVTTGCFGVGVVFRGGHGVTRDVERAADAFQRACDGGLPLACRQKEALAKEK